MGVISFGTMINASSKMHNGDVKYENCLSMNPVMQNVLATSSAMAPKKQKAESPMAKLFIGAGMTWTFELGIGHCLEFLKIAKQTNPAKSYAQLTRDITVQKGVIGIWDGFFPWGTVQALAKGAVFSWAHAATRSVLSPSVENGTIPKDVAEIIAGGIGGGFQGLVLSPTLLLKTRVMTDPVFRNNMSMMQTTKESCRVGMNVIRNEGLPALMKGATVFSMKRVADWSTRFFFSIMAERVMFGTDELTKLTTGQRMAASLVGGTLSTIATLPIDVMVAQIQQASKAGSQVSVFKTFSEQYKKGGLEGLGGFATRGFLARLAHVALTTMLMKTATSIVYEKYESRKAANEGLQ